MPGLHAPLACPAGAAMPGPYSGPVDSDPAPCGSTETPPDAGGRKRVAAEPIHPARSPPPMDTEVDEGAPDVCVSAALEGGPSLPAVVIEVDSSSDETTASPGQPSCERVTQVDAVPPAGGSPTSPALGPAASSDAPTRSASSSTSSTGSSTSRSPVASLGLVRPPCPPVPGPASASSVSASYSPTSIDPNDL